LAKLDARLMAALPLIQDGQTVYRGMRVASWSKRGIVNYKAFMLRPATDKYPAEQEISLGQSIEKAIDELNEHYGVASLSVMRIHLLPHNLTVRVNSQDPMKADIWGLPLHSEDEHQRGIAMSMATDLAQLANLVLSSMPKKR
jgi:hypothetical protein